MVCLNCTKCTNCKKPLSEQGGLGMKGEKEILCLECFKVVVKERKAKIEEKPKMKVYKGKSVKEFHTNGGSIIEKDGMGRYKIDGQRANPKQVQNLVKSHGGKVTEMNQFSSTTDRKFHEIQRSTTR